MAIISRLRKATTNLKTNSKLSKEALKLIWKNRNARKLPKEGSFESVILRRQLKESNMAKPIKNVLRKGLTRVIHKHLRSGKMWVDFREDIKAIENKRGKKVGEEELEALWNKWNTDHANC